MNYNLDIKLKIKWVFRTAKFPFLSADKNNKKNTYFIISETITYHLPSYVIACFNEIEPGTWSKFWAYQLQRPRASFTTKILWSHKSILINVRKTGSKARQEEARKDIYTIHISFQACLSLLFKNMRRSKMFQEGDGVGIDKVNIIDRKYQER